MWRGTGLAAAALAATMAMAEPAAAGCAIRPLPAAPAALLRTELFLGLGLPDGRIVSPHAWAQFEREVLIPRLCGYTVVDARGAWPGHQGRVAHEPAKLLIVVHRPDELADVEAIAALWATRFHQEAVLRTTQPIEGGLIHPGR